MQGICLPDFYGLVMVSYEQYVLKGRGAVSLGAVSYKNVQLLVDIYTHWHFWTSRDSKNIFLKRSKTLQRVLFP